MSRLSKLDDVLFPVAEHPVFVSVFEDGVQRRLAVPDKKAIVNRTSHRVLGVVGRAYRLVSNLEALAMARECCSTVFPETHPGEWQAQVVDAPLTAGYCHIDLVHNTTALDFQDVPSQQRPDVFGPFIRLTNSYNGLRALGFDIGFYRKVCQNGLIIPDTIIRFKFSHVRRDIGETIQFDVAKEKLSKFKNVFVDSLAHLRAYEVRRPQFEPLIRAVLQLRSPNPLKFSTKEAGDWDELNDSLAVMSNRYAHELGQNAYSVFNAITEFASHPPENRCVHRDRNSLQRLAGSWLTTFNSESRAPNFDLAQYLAELAKPKPVVEAFA